MRDIYKEVFGDITPETREMLIKNDVPIPIVIGEKIPITKEEKKLADELWRKLFGDNYSETIIEKYVILL